jgi:hypothetical protein
MLCMASIALANPSVQAQTRVWDFSLAEPLNVWLNALQARERTPPCRKGVRSRSAPS